MSDSSPTSRLIVLSGPAGSGKDTLVDAVIEQADGRIRKTVSATTRSPRPGEGDGVAYHFISRDQFESDIAAGRFVEHAEFGGNLYGTPASEITRDIDAGRVTILVIEVNGSAQIRRRYPDARHIFILPPSRAALASRLAGRGTESPADIKRRLAIAEDEIRCLADYDFLIINHDMARATSELLSIVESGIGQPITGDEMDDWLDGRFA